MGEECDLPGTAIFQRMLLVSLQRTGGLARGATPVANGPRHCGQAPSMALQELLPLSARAEQTNSQATIGRWRKSFGIFNPSAVRGRDAAPGAHSASVRYCRSCN